jgi:hypothetical protein
MSGSTFVLALVGLILAGMIRRRLGKGRRVRGKWNPERTLIPWSKKVGWTLRNAFEGTLILGATGSGKSSGSGRAIADAFLREGFGGLVLTAKAEERRLWETYCRQSGRSRDLIVFGPRERWRFNFLNYELTRRGAGAGLTENIVNLFSTILEMAERNTGQGGGREDEGYWRRACRQLCRNLVDLLVMATGRVSIPDLYRLVVSAPTSSEQICSKEWKANSFCFHCLNQVDRRQKTPQQKRDFATIADYFLVEFPELSSKTRSVIVSTFSSMIDVLNRGVLRDLFCGETNITPEAVERGKIIVLDLPVKEYAEVGQFAQAIFKYCFQRSIERRNIAKSPRPVFLWADEAQTFVGSYDMQFQTTCRAARVATVYLSQNVSNFYAALGGQQAGRAEADSLFGNLNTKIFHANGDPVTNEWAATLIGRTRQFFVNANNSYQGGGWLMNGFGQDRHTSAGVNEQMEFELSPAVFPKLRAGGRENNREVDAVVVQSGQVFADTRKIWRFATFRQRR